MKWVGMGGMCSRSKLGNGVCVWVGGWVGGDVLGFRGASTNTT